MPEFSIRTPETGAPGCNRRGQLFNRRLVPCLGKIPDVETFSCEERCHDPLVTGEIRRNRYRHSYRVCSRANCSSQCGFTVDFPDGNTLLAGVIQGKRGNDRPSHYADRRSLERFEIFLRKDLFSGKVPATDHEVGSRLGRDRNGKPVSAVPHAVLPLRRRMADPPESPARPEPA